MGEMDKTEIKDVQVNREIKDTVFTDLFGDRKNLLKLYKTLHPEDVTATVDSLEDVTMNHILLNGEYNDLGFTVGGRIIILLECQSTWSFNIIIRIFMYLAQTYNDYFKRTEQNLYGSTRVKFPRPELYVVYTGKQQTSDGILIPDSVMSMSEMFFDGEAADVDIKVRVIKHGNKEDILGQYILFANIYAEQMKIYGMTKKAVTETIRICKDADILYDYLTSREKEVVDIMMTLFDKDYLMDVYTKDVTKQAEKQADKRAAARLIKKGKMSLEDIADCYPSLTMDELIDLEEEVLQMA